MDLRRQLQPDRRVDAYGSRNVTVTPRAEPDQRVHPHQAAAGRPGGPLGRHPAPVDVVLAVGGEGWGAGPDEVP